MGSLDLSSRTMVSRKEGPESLRTRRGFGLGAESREREERMSRSRSGASPARRRAGKMDEDTLALRAEEDRDKSGDD